MCKTHIKPTRLEVLRYHWLISVMMYVILLPSPSPSPIANVQCVGIYTTDNKRPSTFATLLHLATRIPSSLCLPFASRPSKTHSPSTTPRSYQASSCQEAESRTCIPPSLIHLKTKSHRGNVNSERRKRDMISLEYVEPSSPNQVDHYGGYGGRERWRGSYRLQGWR